MRATASIRVAGRFPVGLQILTIFDLYCKLLSAYGSVVARRTRGKTTTESSETHDSQNWRDAKENAMNANAEAIYRELPFLEKYFKRNAVNIARVTRVTDEFLALQGTGEAGGKWNPFMLDNGKIMLFTEDGKLLGRVGKRRDLISMLYWAMVTITITVFVILCPEPHSRESVYQRLLDLDEDARYGVWLNHKGELIVYKSPNNTTMRKWYEGEIAKAKRNAMKSVII